MGGSSFLGQAGIYGVQGTPAPGTFLRRYSSVGWQDESGNFWLFVAMVWNSTLTQGFLNDLWEYSNVNGHGLADPRSETHREAMAFWA